MTTGANGAVTRKRLRRSARLVVLAPGPMVLMFRYDIPGREPFWVTAGGECEPGESFEEAARRELLEETGIAADPGPQIARTTPEFVTPEGEPVRADERYFIVRVAEAAIDTSRHTALEQAWMNEHRWFALDELDDWPEALYPEGLRAMIEARLAGEDLG
ncbi:NUDIX hydrolase [Erythrobacter sp. HL-111]|uniref:NUDIX hydrolase n=1 Tax=Erythrobacter sp. HL-111 TaxID=1798193 RepID=UPI0006DAEB8E|nr:NUDIX domain-containing protein [Erythrobacter sp. HL-111]KPP93393.1 MAG: ADP-ribose pyrophosphatase [Erythrobacteraceae bacterium HL-111]SDR70857.1 ADP-ribose pyrophosphatase YjhB, NUDIX family [Erythrobacter sp. HL-111]